MTYSSKIQHNNRSGLLKYLSNRLIKRLSYGTLFLLAMHLLVACIPIAVGVISVTALDISQDRRTVGRNIDDNSLEFQLRNIYSADEQIGSTVNISVTVVNGVVLLTGEVQTDAQRQRATALAKQLIETKKVVNALDLSGKTNLTSRANDAYLTSKVKFKLFRAEGVSASRIKVVTERGKVYLLGIVTQTEATAAINATKSVRGITHIIKVFEYIEVQ